MKARRRHFVAVLMTLAAVAILFVPGGAQAKGLCRNAAAVTALNPGRPTDTVTVPVGTLCAFTVERSTGHLHWIVTNNVTTDVYECDWDAGLPVCTGHSPQQAIWTVTLTAEDPAPAQGAIYIGYVAMAT